MTNGNGKTKNNSSANESTASSNNNGMSSEVMARYEKNKEFRERKQKYIQLDSLINNPRIFQFYPDKIEEKEQEYKGETISRIQYTVTEPMSKYPNVEKYLSLANVRATEMIDYKLFEENKTLLRIWKKGQGFQTQYFVESAQVQPKR